MHIDILTNIIPTYFDIDKLAIMKAIRINAHNLDSLGNINCTLLDAIEQATVFVLACNDLSMCCTMTEDRQRISCNKVFRSIWELKDEERSVSSDGSIQCGQGSFAVGYLQACE